MSGNLVKHSILSMIELDYFSATRPVVRFTLFATSAFQQTSAHSWRLVVFNTSFITTPTGF